MNSEPETAPVPPFRPDSGHFDQDLDPIVAANSSWWCRIGGRSLTLSIIIHAIVILLMVLIVYQISVPAKEQIEFLPGGGGGGKGSDTKAAQKRRAVSISAPKTRVTALTANANVSLPDISTSMSDFSSLTAASPMGGGIGGGSHGLNGSGSGGLMGSGAGSGFGPGMGNGFISIPKLFGTTIDARRMAVVLDMSGSMYSFLPLVIKEVDKVAPGSMVVLHYGCGLSDAEIRDPEVESTSDKQFDKDRIVIALLGSETQAMNQEQREALLAMVKKRAKTYFVPSSGVGSTWVALTDQRLKEVDAIYWFADFADGLSPARIDEVARKLRSRKQKLYIHPSNPAWLTPGDPLAENVAKVEKEIVKPSGGKVIKQEVKKEVPVQEEKLRTLTPPDPGIRLPAHRRT